VSIFKIDVYNHMTMEKTTIATPHVTFIFLVDALVPFSKNIGGAWTLVQGVQNLNRYFN
jgi:hypothetical protein